MRSSGGEDVSEKWAMKKIGGMTSRLRWTRSPTLTAEARATSRSTRSLTRRKT